MTFLLLFLLAYTGAYQAPRSQPTLAADDLAVLTAALDSTVLPKLRDRNSRGRMIALLGNRTTTVRGKDDTAEGKRVSTAGWIGAVVPNPATQWSDLIEGSTLRHELVRAVESRNGEAHTVPAINLPGIQLVTAAQWKQAAQKYGRRVAGSVAVTLPGYARNNRALVYVEYTCGSLCGERWLVVLHRTRSAWRVVSLGLLSVS
jgi:hypothetical protein